MGISFIPGGVHIDLQLKQEVSNHILTDVAKVVQRHADKDKVIRVENLLKSGEGALKTPRNDPMFFSWVDDSRSGLPSELEGCRDGWSSKSIKLANTGEASPKVVELTNKKRFLTDCRKRAQSDSSQYSADVSDCEYTVKVA